jgi:hypothetical protein
LACSASGKDSDPDFLILQGSVTYKIAGHNSAIFILPQGLWSGGNVVFQTSEIRLTMLGML